jgi:hypothetical protein
LDYARGQSVDFDEQSRALTATPRVARVARARRAGVSRARTICARLTRGGAGAGDVASRGEGGEELRMKFQR